MTRNQEISFYSDEQTKCELDELADERGTTRSTLVFELVREELRREREGAVSAETRAAERLQDLLDDGLTDMEDVARQIQDLNAKTGVYAVAAFELVKQSHGEAAIREALQTGARRLREDDVDDLAEGDDDTDGSSEGDDDFDGSPEGDDGRSQGTLDFDALREGSR